jgi:hypothetical protein
MSLLLLILNVSFFIGRAVELKIAQTILMEFYHIDHTESKATSSLLQIIEINCVIPTLQARSSLSFLAFGSSHWSLHWCPHFCSSME